MKNAIKKYLEEAVKTDQALAAVYDETKIEKCCSFITEKAQESYIKQNGRKNGGCYVTPEAIYKMARDFFIDGEYGKVQPLDDQDVTVIKNAQETKTQEKVDIEAVKRQAVEDFKAQEKKKAEERKKAAEEARERKKAEAEAALINPNQLFLFGGVDA